MLGLLRGGGEEYGECIADMAGQIGNKNTHKGEREGGGWRVAAGGEGCSFFVQARRALGAGH